MNLIRKEEFAKRLKAFSWGLGWLVAAEVVAFALASLDLLEIPQGYVVIISLVLREASKHISNRLNVLRRATPPTPEDML